MKRTSSYIDRIARIILAEDDYQYIHDPEHRNKPHGKFWETEKGWSNDPKDNPQNKQNVPRGTNPVDASYFEAIENGNMEVVQKMVTEKAKQMGYDLVAYHGSNIPNIEVFKLGMNNAIFVAQERKEAFLHTKRREGTPKIYPLVVSSKKLFDFRDPKNKKLIKKWVFFNPDNFDGHYTYLEPHSDEIKAMGYDGFYLTEGTDTYAKPNIAIFDPSKIKSIEPIVYRNGKIVPLSERFNQQSNSIYS